MDFQNLLKQAANNQVSKQRELETKKKEIETERKQSKVQQIEQKREAKKRLGQYEQEVIKSRQVYHGIIASSSVPLKNNLTTPSPSTSSKTTKDVSSTRHAQATRPRSMNKSSTPSSIPPPITKHTTHKRPVTSKASASSSSKVTKNKGLPTGKLKSSGMPTDFQELLKLAQKNSGSGKTASSLGDGFNHKGEPGWKPTTSSSIGIGKSLLGKSSKQDEITNQSIKPNLNGNLKRTDDSMHKTGSAVVKTTKKFAESTDKNSKQLTQSPANERVSPYPRPYPRPYPKPASQQSEQHSSKNNIQVTLEKRKQQQLPHNQQINSRGRGSTYPRGRGNGTLKRTDPNKFYSASARLIKDNSLGSSSRLPGYGYTSTWADEMSEYLRNNQYEIEGEDESEFDDFVVDEEDELDDTNDYSSAIRSIFGNKYCSANVNDDDEVMESSFAQQQFEEIRSARIGRLEDEEDIRRERELERKRKLKVPNSTSKKLK